MQWRGDAQQSLLPHTCHVVPQLVNELVHFKGGRQRLNQAGGLDGACSGAGGRGRGQEVVPRARKNSGRDARAQVLAATGAVHVWLGLGLAGRRSKENRWWAVYCQLSGGPPAQLTHGDVQLALRIHKDVVPETTLQVGLHLGLRHGKRGGECSQAGVIVVDGRGAGAQAAVPASCRT
jgi:hypothetical protein